MKILYAVQRTGNGHLARAQDLIPILEKYGEVKILASGSQSQITLPKVVDYSYEGLSLFYDKNGALSYPKILAKNRVFQFIRQVFSFPVHDFDLIINDFEPITAWACRLRGGNIISLSHQSSMLFSQTPQPLKTDRIGQFFLRYYAPIKTKYGFHFEKYHPQIFTPVIRQKIRMLRPTTEEKILVYLPAYSNEKLLSVLSQLPIQCMIFNKELKDIHRKGNCELIPIDEDLFMKELSSCKGVLCSAGFELPAEALFLKKKLFVIPIQKQLEQKYNAASLSHLGVSVSEHLDLQPILQWLKEEKEFSPTYPDESEKIIDQLIKKHSSPYKTTYKMPLRDFLFHIVRWGYLLR